MSRNLGEVLETILPLMPKSELKHQFTKLKSSACFRAPETHPELWGRGGQYLFEYFGERMPAPGWEADIVAIWTDQKS